MVSYLALTFPAIRWVRVVAAVFLVIFNVVGLPYPRAESGQRFATEDNGDLEKLKQLIVGEG